MTVAGEFRAPTVQRLEADPDRETKFFNAELAVAKEKRTTFGQIADGIDKFTRVSGALATIDGIEARTRQTEVDTKQSQIAAEEAKILKEEEKEILRRITTGSEVEQIEALETLQRDFSPQAIQNVEGSIKMRVRALKNRGSDMAKDAIIHGGLGEIYTPELEAERRQQDRALEQIRERGRQERITKEQFPPQTSSVSGQSLEFRKQQAADAAKEKKQKAATEQRDSLRTRDFDIAANEINTIIGGAAGDDPAKEARAKAQASDLINQLSQRKLAIDRALVNSPDGSTIVLNGRQTTVEQADAEAINSIMQGINGTVRTVAQQQAAASPTAVPTPVAGATGFAQSGQPNAPAPVTPDLQPKAGEPVELTPAGNQVDSKSLEIAIEARVQSEIAERAAQGQGIRPEKIPTLRAMVRERVLDEYDANTTNPSTVANPAVIVP